MLAMATTPKFTNEMNVQLVDIANADGTTAESLFTAGTTGSRVDAIVATTDEDTANCVIVLSVSDGTITMPLGEITVAHSSAVAVDLLDGMVGLDADGALFLGAGWTLEVNLKTAITAAKTCWIKATGGDY